MNDLQNSIAEIEGQHQSLSSKIIKYFRQQDELRELENKAEVLEKEANSLESEINEILNQSKKNIES